MGARKLLQRGRIAVALALCLLFSGCGEGGKPADLTLEDVRTLAQKGTALTWEDLADYRYLEVGSGLYILRYPIDETYSLLVGGPSPEAPPVYVSLIDWEGEAVDIREGDLEAFLQEDRKVRADSAPGRGRPGELSPAYAGEDRVPPSRLQPPDPSESAPGPNEDGLDEARRQLGYRVSDYMRENHGDCRVLGLEIQGGASVSITLELKEAGDQALEEVLDSLISAFGVRNHGVTELGSVDRITVNSRDRGISTVID